MKPVSIRALGVALAASMAGAPLAVAPLSAQDTNAVVEPEFEAENDPFIWLEETRSDRALEWIRRGYRLAADDRVRLRVRAEDPCLLGTAPTPVAVAARETTPEAGH